jgi:hypothetical protein
MPIHSLLSTSKLTKLNCWSAAIFDVTCPSRSILFNGTVDLYVFHIETDYVSFNGGVALWVFQHLNANFSW